MSGRGRVAPIRWEPELLARAVADQLEREERAGRPALRARYRRAAEPLYALAPDERAAAFHELDLDTARKLGLDEPVAAELAAARRAGAEVVDVVLSPATTAAAAGADLEPRADGPRVIVRAAPSLVGAGEPWIRFLRHELAHVDDLLDPAFGFDGNRRLAGRASAEASTRDRYRALWCASIDARAARAGRLPHTAADASALACARAFALRADDVAALRARLAQERPNHAVLLACAERPAELARWCPGVHPDAARTRRSTCPACSFPAFPVCRDAGDLPPAALAAVRADVPGWDPADGLCDRCREVYLHGGAACA